MAGPLYLSRFVLEEDGLWTFDAIVDGVTVNAIEFPAGTYYLDSSTAAESFVAVMDNLLTTNFGGETFTVTYSTTTGLITYNCSSLSGGGTWSLNFVQDEFGAVAGFDGAGGGFLAQPATVVADNVSAGAIFASSSRTGFPLHYGADFGYSAVQTRGGPIAGLSTEAEHVTAAWSHDFEPQYFSASPLESGTWNDATEQWPWSWQDFFRHHAKGAHAGQPFRIYEAPGDAVADYEREVKLIKHAMFRPKTTEPEHARYWTVAMEVGDHVEAAA